MENRLQLNKDQGSEVTKESPGKVVRDGGSGQGDGNESAEQWIWGVFCRQS